MAYKKFEAHKCRICLQEDIIIHWNDNLPNYNNLTYKDCYYKYTQLDCFDENNSSLSAMLCRNCSDGLEYINALITKAIETNNFLQENIALHVECKQDSDKDLISFETVLFSENDIKPELENDLYEDSSKETPNKERDSWSKAEVFAEKQVSVLKSPNIEYNIEGSVSWIITEDNGSVTKHVPNEDCLEEESDILENSTKQSTKRKSVKEKSEKNNTKTTSDELQSGKSIPAKKHKSAKWEIPTCCSICSKVLTSKYKAIQHEKTHVKNRERTESCVHCGMKFFSKECLKSHMITHIENREKNRKCEFCDKAFYNTGALNIHRRIHLGQMIKCTLCTKEYYRQVDLDKHMISHSAAKVSGDLKTKKKYFVRCEICAKNVRSCQYKSHYAKHINEPLAKCAICNKEFFSRASCATHLKKVHKKGGGEKNDFIISYKTKYYSKLFLEQTTGSVFTQ